MSSIAQELRNEYDQNIMSMRSRINQLEIENQLLTDKMNQNNLQQENDRETICSLKEKIDKLESENQEKSKQIEAMNDSIDLDRTQVDAMILKKNKLKKRIKRIREKIN